MGDREVMHTSTSEIYYVNDIRKQRITLLQKLASFTSSTPYNAGDLALQCTHVQRVADELPLPVAYQTFEQFPDDLLGD
jgi:hypothetical protein